MAEPTIVLFHQRHPELVDNRHLFSGSVEVQSPAGERISRSVFSRLRFHRMVAMVSTALQDHPEAPVVFQRTDRPGLAPVQLGEQLRVLLRNDPVAAIHAMDQDLGQRAQLSTPTPVLRAGYDTLAAAFGERIFLRMKTGAIANPLTGHWSELAYGPKIGWRIRGENNASETWLKIRLEGVEIQNLSLGSAEEMQKALEAVAGELARCEWASVDVGELLQQNVSRFYLPYEWNTDGQWIDRAALRARLDSYKKEKSES